MVVLGEEIEPNPTEAPALAESYGRFVDELRARGWIGNGRPVQEPATTLN
jgi:hypothetical protein